MRFLTEKNLEQMRGPGLTGLGSTKLGATHFCDHPRFCLTGPVETWGNGPWIDCLRCEANGPLPVTWAIRGPITARRNEPAE